MFNGNFMTKLR